MLCKPWNTSCQCAHVEEKAIWLWSYEVCTNGGGGVRVELETEIPRSLSPLESIHCHRHYPKIENSLERIPGESNIQIQEFYVMTTS